MAQTSEQAQFARLIAQMAPDAELLRYWQLAGGISAQVTALEIRHADGSLQKVVIRQHGAADLMRNPHIAADEYRLLQILQSAGIAAPAPLYLDQSGILQQPCLVVAFVEGSTDITQAEPEAIIAQAAGALAQIHQLDPVSCGLHFLPQTASHEIERLLIPPADPDESLQESLIRATLSSAGTPAPCNPAVLLHGDFWYGNLLWQAGTLRAVLDWEDACRGDPLADLANARLETLWAFGSDALQTFTRRYLAQMPALDTSSLSWWDLHAALRPMHVLAAWAGSREREQIMRERHHWFVRQAVAQLLSP